MVLKYMFFTKGVSGRIGLASFELTLRKAGIERFNIVTSVFIGEDK